MSRSPSNGEWVWWACSFLLAGAVVGVAAWRIHTYVTGQDPAIYIDLARTLLREPPGSDAFRAALFQLAPGYPLLLAGSIRLFGELAPFWVNSICLAIGLGLLARILIDGGMKASDAGLAMLWSCLVLLTGYGLNPHFLLYPFRESPAWCLAMAGLWWTQRSAVRSSRFGLVLGALWLLAACAIREPMVFVVVGAAGWMATGNRRGGLGWFLLPVGAGAVPALVLASRQARYLAGRLLGTDTPGPEVIGSCLAMLAALLDELRPWGVGLLVFGAWTARKRATTWWFFLGPALLLVLFHAWTGMHRRYVLSVLAFLSPVVGIGFARVVRLVTQVPAARAAGGAGTKAQAAAMAAVALVLLAGALRLEPWGPRVRRTELRTFKEAVASFARPGDRIYSEWACRHLADAVGSFTAQRPGGNPLPVSYTLGLPGTGYFLKPLNPEAYYADHPHPSPVRMEHLLRYHADLVPLDREVTLAGGRFAVHRLAPWSATRVTNRVYGKAGRRLVIWLDLQAAAPEAPKHLRVRSAASGAVLLEREVASGNGLMAVALGGPRMAHRVVEVEVTSETVLPRQVVSHATFDDQPIVFTLLEGRLRSVYDWFQPPFAPMVVERKHLAVFREGGTLHLPPVYGDARRLEALLTITPAAGGQGRARVTYQANGAEPVPFDGSLAEPRLWHGFTVPVQEGATPPVTIAVDPPDAHGHHLRVEQVKLWVR